MAALISSPTLGRTTSPLQSFEVSVTGAETKIAKLGGVLRPGVNNLGVYVQAVGTAVTPSLTLDNPATVDKGDATWFTLPVIPAGNIVNLGPNLVGTAVRLQFAGAGRAIVASL